MKKLFSCFFSLILFFLMVPSVEAASFSFEPNQADKVKQEEFEVKLKLDTKGEEVSGVDIVLEFNKEVLEVKGVEFNNLFPLNDVQIDNVNGSLKLYSTVNSVGTAFKGNDRLVTLKLKGIKVGEGSLTFKCLAGETGDDTNIWKKGGGDIVECSALGSGKYFIKDGCETPKPPENVKAKAGPGSGQITLNWDKSSGVKYYNITYGPSSLHYEWGNPNVGDVSEYIVSGLTPGSPYYFIVSAVNDCGSSGALYEVAAYAGRDDLNDDGYWQGPEVVDYIPDVATPSAEATASALPTPKPSPLSEAEEEGKSVFDSIGQAATTLSSRVGEVLQSTWLRWFILIVAILIILAVAGKRLVEKDSGEKQAVEEEVRETEETGSWPPPSTPPSTPEEFIPEARTDTQDMQETQVQEEPLSGETFNEPQAVEPEARAESKTIAQVLKESQKPAAPMESEPVESIVSEEKNEFQPEEQKPEPEERKPQDTQEPEWIKQLRQREDKDETSTGDQS